MPARLAGPGLLAAGLASLALAWRLPGLALADWLIGPGLPPFKLLPLVGLALLAARLPGRLAAAAVVLWLAGALAGDRAYAPLLSLLHRLPHAAAHEFFTLPLACLPLGLLLLAPARLVRWPALGTAPLVGALFGVAIRLGVPGFHVRMAWWLGLAAGLWLLVGLTLTLHAWRGRWREIATPIAGAWLLAIGLLYGAVGWVDTASPTDLGAAPDASAIHAPTAQDAFAGFGDAASTPEPHPHAPTP